MKGLKEKQKADIASLAKMKDSEIDLTDMPEVLDWSGAKVGRFYRKKKASAFRSRKTEKKTHSVG